MATTKTRIKTLIKQWEAGELVDVSDIAEPFWSEHRVLIQKELYDFVETPGTWLMVPIDSNRCEYVIQELLTCIWQWMQFHKDWYLGGQAIHIPITFSKTGDLLVVSELLLNSNNSVSKIILITIADDQSNSIFYGA